MQEQEKSGQPVSNPPEANTESEFDFMIEKVREELRQIDSDQGKGILKNLITLGISIFIFISLGLFRNSVSGIAMLVGVIFIHELGHWLGMKFLKYKDVKMFFIPMLGAAVSGKETSPSGTKKVIVSLLGPVPGIFIGIGTGIAYLVTREPLLLDATRTFLFINAFNLLPIHPLDGGRIFDALLFSRHPKIEITFKVIAALIMAALAFLLKDIFFGIFAFFVFLSLQNTYLIASIAHMIGKGIENEDDLATHEVPDKYLKQIVTKLKEKIPAAHFQFKLIAIHTSNIWQRVRNRPCSIITTIGLLLCYMVFILFAIGSVFAFEMAVYAIENPEVLNENYEPNTLQPDARDMNEK